MRLHDVEHGPAAELHEALAKGREEVAAVRAACDEELRATFAVPPRLGRVRVEITAEVRTTLGETVRVAASRVWEVNAADRFRV